MSAQQGTFIVTDGDSRLLLKPEKRRYAVSGNVLTEAAIDPGFLRDVYVSLGEELDGGGLGGAPADQNPSYAGSGSVRCLWRSVA